MEMASHDRNGPGWRPAGRRGRRIGQADPDSKQDLAADRREIIRLRRVWDQVASDGLPPPLDMITQFLGEDGWNRRFLVAQDPDPLSSVFITCGATIDQMLGDDVKGRTLRDIIWEGCRPLFDACIEAAQRRAPIAVDGILRNVGNTQFPFRGVILPFGSSRDCIPYLLGVVGWRQDQPMA